jgi:hypothetical protein
MHPFKRKQKFMPRLIFIFILALAILLPQGAFSQGKLYGTMHLGGSEDNSNGQIFEYDLSSGISTIKYTFPIDQLNYPIDGGTPYGNLIQTTAGKIYGATIKGGYSSAFPNYDVGVLYEFDVNTSIYTKVFDFSKALGVRPIGGIMRASNGKL